MNLYGGSLQIEKIDIKTLVKSVQMNIQENGELKIEKNQENEIENIIHQKDEDLRIKWKIIFIEKDLTIKKVWIF